MKTLYYEQVIETLPAGATILTSKRIHFRKVLFVHSVTVFWGDTNGADFMSLRVQTNQAQFPVSVNLVTVVENVVSNITPVVLSAGMQFVAVGDLTSTPADIRLSIIGELYDDHEWEQDISNIERHNKVKHDLSANSDHGSKHLSDESADN